MQKRFVSVKEHKGEKIEKIKKKFIESIEKNTPQKIKENPIFNLKNPDKQIIRIDSEKIKEWKIHEWLSNYKKEAIVSTAGIRGAQNILYPWDTRFPLNQLGVALATLGKAAVLSEDITDRQINKICAGDVRYNTDSYIELISRLQAAQGIKTHLPFNNDKTSIWMTSFLLFMLDYDGGEYVTCSHSVVSKIATKDLDNQGSQFIPKMSVRFVKKIEEIVEKAEKEGFNIVLSEKNSSLIVNDFDGFNMYTNYLKHGVATKKNIEIIKNGINNGLEIMCDCIGGCMYPIASNIMKNLEIYDIFVWANIEHDSFFHGIGKIEKSSFEEKGFYDYGCDTSVKKVVETMGYDQILKDKKEGYVSIIMDPDGDRIGIGQIENSQNISKLEKMGLGYIRINAEKVFVFYQPNQAFLLIMNFYANQLKKANLWNNHPRFIITTTASADSWNEWANYNNVKIVSVPVGFKEIASMIKKVEKQIEKNPRGEVKIHDIYGKLINLGVQPRLLFGGEESGGMISGPEELIKSNNGRIAISMREKSAGESLLLLTALVADLFERKKLISDYLIETFNANKISRRIDLRKDLKFYDENNPNPEELKKTKLIGEKKRDKLDSFFLSIALGVRKNIINLAKAKEIFTDAMPELNFDSLKAVHFVGDGAYFDFNDKFLEVRKSGTDAAARIYCSGENKADCVKYAQIVANYSGKLTQKFNEAIPKEFYDSCQNEAINILREFQSKN